MRINNNKSNKNKNAGDSKPKTLSEAFAAFNWRLAGTLLFNCVVIVGLYLYLVSFPFWKYVIIAYVAALGIMLIVYFIYNRGFSMRGVTYDMLPDTMHDDEKKALIEQSAERERRSRWMLTVIFPLLLAFICELLNLYLIQPMLGSSGIL